MAKTLTPEELIMTHIPKKIEKYKFIIKDDELFDELVKSESFDMEILDTIKNDKLVDVGYHMNFMTFDRTVVAKAKQPTTIDEDKGIVVSKQLITKADKKLLSVGVATFGYENASYVMVKFEYEKFDIVEIFLLVE